MSTGKKQHVYIVLIYNPAGSSRVDRVYSTDKAAQERVSRLESNLFTGETLHIIKKSVRGTSVIDLSFSRDLYVNEDQKNNRIELASLF